MRKIVVVGIITLLCMLSFPQLPACVAATEKNQTPYKYFSTEELAGKRVGVAMGYGADVAVTKAGLYEVHRYLGGTDMAMALKAGNLEGFAAERSYAEQLAGEIPGLVILPGVVGSERYIAIFNKDDKQLRDEVDAAIGKIIASPVYTEMVERWLGGDQDAAQMPEIPAGTGETLTVALESEYEPFAYFAEGGERKGFDVEMILRIGALTNRKIEFFETSYSSIFIAVNSGYADMSLCAIDYKPALHEKFLLTRQYYGNDVVMVVLSEVTPEDTGFFGKICKSVRSHLFVEKRYTYILEGLLNTLLISVIAALLGTLLGALLCASLRCKNSLLQAVAELYIRVLQGTPIIVLLLIITYVIFAGSGVDTILISGVAFSLYFSTKVAVFFCTSLGAVDYGQVEAAKAMGLSSPQTYRLVLLPQAAVMALPLYSSNLVDMVKLTSVVGYVGVMDLTYSIEMIRSRTYEAIFPLLLETLLYIILTSLITSAFRIVAAKIDPKRKKRSVRL